MSSFVRVTDNEWTEDYVAPNTACFGIGQTPAIDSIEDLAVTAATYGTGKERRQLCDCGDVQMQ